MPHPHADYGQVDFGSAPLMFYYEVTQACDLACQHCRASAQPIADPHQLTPVQSRALLDQVASFPRPPVVVFTGGDPLKRPDLLELIRHARDKGLQIALTPSATPLATREASSHPGRRRRAPLGVGDGKGIMFVSHTGEIYPAGFLPLECGRFPDDSVVDTYQNHPTFRSLRDPEQFSGKCGVCEYRDACGGSRSRAYAVFGDPLASEPDCAYSPIETDVVANLS